MNGFEIGIIIVLSFCAGFLLCLIFIADKAFRAVQSKPNPDFELKSRLGKLIGRLSVTKLENKELRKKLDEMEKRWRFAKEQKEKWRKEKNELKKQL